jgi:hypothetical protein
LRQLRWVGVFLGAAVTTPLTLGLTLFVFSVVDSRLYRAFIAEGAGTTAREQALFDGLSGASHLAAVLLAPFLGGLLVGRVIAASPGTNAAVGAAVAAVGVFAWFVGPVVPWIWEPISNPGEAYTRSDNVNNLIVVSAVFCGIVPFIILAGYLGGRLGGRLRAPRAAP